MTRYTILPIHRTIAAIAVASALVACGDDDTIVNVTPITTDRYAVTKLVSDVNGAGAVTVDPNLVNAWGLAFNPAFNVMWVANEGTGTSTVYDVNGVPLTPVVTIPTATAATGGQPTGIVYNGTNDFVITGGNPAAYLFAGIDGALTAWNGGSTAHVV